MKRFLILSFFLCTAISFAQTGLIVGKVLDKEADNTPMPFANVSVKGTSLTATSDFSGVFMLENMEAGDYTLVFNFPGYESKEVKVKVDAVTPSEIKLALGAFTMPAMETASVESSDKAKSIQVTSTTTLN